MAYNILIVEDEPQARQYIAAFLRKQGYEITEAPTYAQAIEALSRGQGDIVLLDIQLPDNTYALTLLDEIADWPNRPPVIVITGFGDIETAVEAMRGGAYDFLQKPIKFERLMQSLKKSEEIVAMRRELTLWRQQQQSKAAFVVGKSAAMQEVLHLAQRAAQAGASVLIQGETGTGKEVLARYIHQSGPRASKPFVPINCAAVPESMLEAELFGYEAGAFTGANKRKPGLMELADGGVLFLDEIASLPANMQAKLLRALEERVIRRMGGTKWIPVDVQVLAASNRDLQEMVSKGAFREDLYYRLNVLQLRLPPLRERREDIPALVGFWVQRLAQRSGRVVHDVTPQAMEALQRYSWPGNIRELRNALERALLFCDGEVIGLEHLPPEVAAAYHR